MTDADATKLLAILAAGFEKELSDETIAVYTRQLARYHRADAEAATQRLFDSCRFFPMLAEIRDAFESAATERRVAALRPGGDDPPRLVYQVWSAAADAYLPLPTPRPYDEALDGAAARVRRFEGETLPGDPTPALPATVTERRQT